MKIYNSMTQKKEEFIPIEKGKVKIYSCGPTVYDYIHIGNARPMIMFDVLRRYLEYKGLEVNFVQNFTDIDDKIINRANKEGISSMQLQLNIWKNTVLMQRVLGSDRQQFTLRQQKHTRNNRYGKTVNR